jgi:predicted alpha/beta hydrolase family esterase
MGKNALILHAWHNSPKDQWYPWLKSTLEKKGYIVHIPELPTMNTDLPNLSIQINVAEKYITKNTVVVGHSLGALLALRLAEKYTYQKMILLAGWDFNDLTTEHRLFWKNPMNHTAIKKHVKEIYCLSSDNDPYYTAFTVEDMSKRLDGKFILVKRAGHFTKQFGITTIPVILPLV